MRTETILIRGIPVVPSFFVGSYDELSAQFAYYNDKGTRRKREIYISFIRYPHDLRIERESCDYTSCQIEESDTSYRDTCRDLKNVTVIAVAPEKMSHGALLLSRPLCLFRWRRPDWTRDIVRRMTQYHDRELWYWERILLESDVLMEHAELSVAMRGLDEFYERSIPNVSRDRLNKIQYSDHVKSQYSVILRHETRSWIYFIYQK